MTERVVRIASWNIKGGGSKAALQVDHLRNTLSAEVMLLQEAAAPEEDAIFLERQGRNGKKARGVAIIAVGDIEVRFEKELSRGNGVVVSLPGCDGLVIANVHNLKGIGDTYASSMMRCIDEILEVVKEGSPVMIAGDYNCSMDLVTSYPDMPRVFARLRDRGFRDAMCNQKCETTSSGQCISKEHPKTYRRGRGSWRIDHIYANRALMPMVSGALTGEEDAWDLSDHRPIVCDLRVLHAD